MSAKKGSYSVSGILADMFFDKDYLPTDGNWWVSGNALGATYY